MQIHVLIGAGEFNAVFGFFIAVVSSLFPINPPPNVSELKHTCPIIRGPCSWRDTVVGEHTKMDNLVQVLPYF